MSDTKTTFLGSWFTPLLLLISPLVFTQARSAPPIGPPASRLTGGSSPAHDLEVSKAWPDAPRRSALAFLQRRITSDKPRHGSWGSPPPQGHRLLEVGGEVDPALLPALLPALPRATDISVQRLVQRSKRAAPDVRGRYVWLERQAAILRGSSDLVQRSFSRRLRGYLGGYKLRWASTWIHRRLRAFPPSPIGTRMVVRYLPGVRVEEREPLRQRVWSAWSIASSAVHPRLLQRLPTIQIEVSRRYPGPGIIAGPDGAKIITLLPNSPIKDILHEIGHLVEAYGGIQIQATAHAMRARRAFGTPPQPLPQRGSRRRVTGYDGAYADRYMGRHYGDGLTEMISMGFERFSLPHQALELFMEDGEHLLLLLKALQHVR